jgi:hypothetical protein
MSLDIVYAMSLHILYIVCQCTICKLAGNNTIALKYLSNIFLDFCRLKTTLRGKRTVVFRLFSVWLQMYAIYRLSSRSYDYNRPPM